MEDSSFREKENKRRECGRAFVTVDFLGGADGIFLLDGQGDDIQVSLSRRVKRHPYSMISAMIGSRMVVIRGGEGPMFVCRVCIAEAAVNQPHC